MLGKALPLFCGWMCSCASNFSVVFLSLRLGNLEWLLEFTHRRFWEHSLDHFISFSRSSSNWIYWFTCARHIAYLTSLNATFSKSLLNILTSMDACPSSSTSLWNQRSQWERQTPFDLLLQCKPLIQLGFVHGLADLSCPLSLVWFSWGLSLFGRHLAASLVYSLYWRLQCSNLSSGSRGCSLLKAVNSWTCRNAIP